VLNELAGGAALCTIARSGASFPAGKYQEGAVAAMGQVRRVLRGPDASGLAPLEAVATAQQVWEQTVGPMVRDADWTAYLEGGRDALAGLAEDLGADATG
jgi:hypothetical protein